ncbi:MULTISPECIES: EAL domain-containing protein [Klebsiella]|jgi:sensor c-di-GMP phosphodiesterase-like protein|uniref:cyclic-guanylate-specific phosphodiesterase n=3 Tax=Klebsiella aerogenes TaxID=548 RepID=A0AAW9DYL6_KLEAE|nr:EAL domain-containing protein [Klebsiella aerogenes]MCL6718918.1 EAL domain-containing protein [Klebsiella sp. T2.Ur]AEG99418.1 diguanylate phosphodiesterase [Klebsiella aerogenes KCTC 2190]AKK79852.1 c-di-GMP phosphodiesterase [Klebsiella aerogenes]AMH08306.1 cyclic di-GMP phosphodiesterase [Klebsiella aerogenes]AML34724.1 Putative cyclic-di-GMP phosphodiesterase AdrB [Klebsiella aerogenes]
MQNAQKVISTYRRKRILVCLAVAFLTLAVTLTIRFISQRSQNQQRIQTVTRNMVIAMDNILQPLAAKHATLLSMVGKPCQDVHLELRKTAATLQTVRSIILVQSGMAYCSSIFGPRHVAIHQLQPTLPAVNPLLAFSTDNSLLKGTPVLIQWYPSSVSGADGALLIINIELLGELILKEKSSLISDISLTVGNKSFLSDVGVVASDRLPGLPIIYRQSSSQFPFTINISGPGASAVALEELPAELPLALMFSLLMTGIAWLTTAGRMTFSREITLGIAAHEFEVWCQPLQDLRTQECCGVEILLRWNNPRRGNISPDVFIPIAEGYNLIVPLTRYVIAETARRLHYFPQDANFHIGINVAARHFSNGELLRDLHTYWFSANPVQQLVVELTERDVLREGDHHMAEHLHFKGVQLAIDDFGTGNSSLSWLEKLRPDVLKIDKSYTGAIGIDGVNATVTDMIIALAHRLKIVTIAEGVETQEQKIYMRSHGVDLLQGYYYARPLPVEDFPRWLAEEKHRLAATGGKKQPAGQV